MKGIKLHKLLLIQVFLCLCLNLYGKGVINCNKTLAYDYDLGLSKNTAILAKICCNTNKSKPYDYKFVYRIDINLKNNESISVDAIDYLGVRSIKTIECKAKGCTTLTVYDTSFDKIDSIKIKNYCSANDMKVEVNQKVGSLTIPVKIEKGDPFFAGALKFSQLNEEKPKSSETKTESPSKSSDAKTGEENLVAESGENNPS